MLNQVSITLFRSAEKLVYSQCALKIAFKFTFRMCEFSWIKIKKKKTIVQFFSHVKTLFSFVCGLWKYHICLKKMHLFISLSINRLSVLIVIATHKCVKENNEFASQICHRFSRVQLSFCHFFYTYIFIFFPAYNKLYFYFTFSWFKWVAYL